MRCLRGKTYDHAGKCPVCHMDLKMIESAAPAQAAPRPEIEAWPRLQGKTAIYYRPYTVSKVAVDRLLRLAGQVSKDRRHLLVRLAEGEPPPPKGSSAMVSPAEGYFRPVFGSVERVSKAQLRIAASRRLEGFEQASVEIRLPGKEGLAVPLEAISESDGRAWAYRQGPDGGYQPVSVTVGERGERFIEVSRGLAAGDVVAASGVFWLEAQWRMDHP